MKHLVRALVALLAPAGIVLALLWFAIHVVGSSRPVAPPAAAASHTVVTRATWARQANRICGRQLRALESTMLAAVHKKTRGQVFALFARFQTTEERYLAQLRTIPPPRHDAARVRRMLDLRARILTIDRTASAALRRGDRPAFLRIGRQKIRLVRRMHAIARALGAKACAQS